MKNNNEPFPAAHEATSIDFQNLFKKLGGDYQQIAKCLAIFKTDAPISLKSIKAGLTNVDSKLAKNACHGLRGMLITLEMRSSAIIAARLEALIIEKDFNGARNVLLPLEREINLAVASIQDSINERKFE